MIFLRLLVLLSGLSIILSGCNALGDAKKVLKNEKMRTNDEFLIKKKNPLIKPPEFETIPTPGSVENKKKQEQNSFEKIIKKGTAEYKDNQTKSSSTEESILNQIKK